MNQLKIQEVALSLIPGIGNVIGKQLISYCGSVEQVFRSNRKQLLRIPGIGEKTAESVLKKETLKDAEEIINICDKEGIDVLFYTNPEYPNRLKHVLDSPLVIYHKGTADLNFKKAIAIVGTRSITRYGKDVIEQMVHDLKPYNPQVISGLAYGVDVHAHITALKNGLSTIGVLGGGIGKLYPVVHKKIAEQMLSQGGLISEYTYNTIPEAHHFPERNRIIAALSDAVIVIEAARKGGALITAEYANSYNREVFAIPGNLGHPYSQGCNHLIKIHKAHILTSVKDIEYIMNWDIFENTQNRIFPELDDLSEEEVIVIQTFMENNKELIIDDLSWKSQIPLNKLASILLSLEFKGLIKNLPGKKFKLTG